MDSGTSRTGLSMEIAIRAAGAEKNGGRLSMKYAASVSVHNCGTQFNM